MKNKMLLILAVLPLVALAALWGRVPAEVPLNWGFNGTVDYGSRVQLWLLAAIPLLMLGLFRILPEIDPKRQNYPKFAGSYQAFRWIFVLFFDVVFAIVLTEGLRPGTMHVSRVMLLLTGLLLMLLGNRMPCFRQNWFCGIRTPWTLASERVWTRTHRLGGRLFFAAGILVMAASFLPELWGFAALMAVTLAATLIPVAMSWVWYREAEKTE